LPHGCAGNRLGAASGGPFIAFIARAANTSPVLRVEPITSLDAPELEPYRTMRRSEEHRSRQIFVAEGEKVVRRLLESSLPVVSVLLPEKWLAEYRLLLEKRPEMITAYLAEKDLLETLVGFSMYQGVLAIGRIPKLPTLEEVIAASPPPRLFVALDGLTNAENLGGLVRNCAAFGVQALLISKTSSSPYLRRSVRGSMGTVFKMPVVEELDLPRALYELRARKIHCIAAHPHTSGLTLPQVNFAQDCCVVFGSEGYGIAPAVLNACDDAVAVPMALEVDSMNVGSAAAVFLYEANRQRGKMILKSKE
jgi:tRNA G18 (ribose-2'-O)-methylase SpoU